MKSSSHVRGLLNCAGTLSISTHCDIPRVGLLKTFQPNLAATSCDVRDLHAPRHRHLKATPFEPDLLRCEYNAEFISQSPSEPTDNGRHSGDERCARNIVWRQGRVLGWVQGWVQSGSRVGPGVGAGVGPEWVQSGSRGGSRGKSRGGSRVGPGVGPGVGLKAEPGMGVGVHPGMDPGVGPGLCQGLGPGVDPGAG